MTCDWVLKPTQRNRRCVLPSMSICNILIALFAFYPATACAKVESSGEVTLRPGDDIQAAVSKMAPGTKFFLEPGIYRLQSINPKDRQEFIGKDGTRIVGAVILKGWEPTDDGLWKLEGLPPNLRLSGSCELEGSKLCMYREDLFVDGVLYERVASVEDLGPKKWLSEGDTAFVKEDLSKRLTELSVLPFAFRGFADGVKLENLTVEKYATEAQLGAIDGSRSSNWTLTNVSARWNHGGGLDLGFNMIVRGGSYSHNGQIGIVGDRDGAVLDGVEIAYNNYAKYSVGWEAGGTKFTYTHNLVVRNSCVHNNHGPGLWTDIDNLGTLYENNVVFDNTGDGIKHEISGKAIIRNNITARNGSGHDIWGWGSQIIVQNSSNVEVYDNIAVVAPNHGNGISIIHQDRGGGRIGRYMTTGNKIYENLIVYRGKKGLGGRFADHDRKRFFGDTTNVVDRNTYVAPIPDRKYWETNTGEVTWRDLQKSGMERNGTFKVEKRAALQLSCKNRPSSK